jgi:hypothetical protein
MGTGSRQQQESRTPTVECRSEPRFETSLPVRLLAGSTGVTRDISASGVSFELPQGGFTEGDCIDFSVEFEDAGGKRKWSLACAARVVRIRQGDGVQQVAAKIHESRLELQR